MNESMTLVPDPAGDTDDDLSGISPELVLVDPELARRLREREPAPAPEADSPAAEPLRAAPLLRLVPPLVELPVVEQADEAVPEAVLEPELQIEREPEVEPPPVVEASVAPPVADPEPEALVVPRHVDADVVVSTPEVDGAPHPAGRATDRVPAVTELVLPGWEPRVDAAPVPVVVPEPEPVVVSEPEPVVVSEPEPVVVSEPEPVVVEPARDPAPVAAPVVAEARVAHAAPPRRRRRRGLRLLLFVVGVGLASGAVIALSGVMDRSPSTENATPVVSPGPAVASPSSSASTGDTSSPTRSKPTPTKPAAPRARQTAPRAKKTTPPVRQTPPAKKQAAPAKPPAAAATEPRRFAWAPVQGALRYHVELFRGAERILATDTTEPVLEVGPSWRYQGDVVRLTPGSYRWYVWPVTKSGRAAQAVVQAKLDIP